MTEHRDTEDRAARWTRWMREIGRLLIVICAIAISLGILWMAVGLSVGQAMYPYPDAVSQRAYFWPMVILLALAPPVILVIWWRKSRASGTPQNSA